MKKGFSLREAAFWAGTVLTAGGITSTANNLLRDERHPNIDHTQSALAAVLGHDVVRPILTPSTDFSLPEYGPPQVRNTVPRTGEDKKHGEWHLPDRLREKVAANVRNIYLTGLGVPLMIMGCGRRTGRRRRGI